MIFMHKESGELFELMIKSLSDFVARSNLNEPLFRPSSVLLVGLVEAGYHNFSEEFEFVGFI